MRNRTILTLLGLSLLLSFAPLSAATVIQHGIDVFTTSDNGKTFYDFSYTPIPAGFFCAGSKAFTGKVALEGPAAHDGARGPARERRHDRRAARQRRLRQEGDRHDADPVPACRW